MQDGSSSIACAGRRPFPRASVSLPRRRHGRAVASTWSGRAAPTRARPKSDRRPRASLKEP